MAIQRTAPLPITLGTALQSLGSTNAAQSSEVPSTTSNNITDIVANWTLSMGSVTASASTRVDVYCWGTNDDSGWPGPSSTNELITGTAGTIVLSANGTSAIRFLKSTPLLISTTAHTVRDEASIVSALGFVPRRWGLVFSNQTGGSLGASGHLGEYVETYYN